MAKKPQPVVMPQGEKPMVIKATYRVAVGHEANLPSFRTGAWGKKGRKNRGATNRRAIAED